MRERLVSRAGRPTLASEPKGDSISLPHRAEIERATGFDFRQVRAYADRDGMTQIGANAASIGNKVWFAESNPPLTTVAHELAHVRQADGLSTSSPQHIGASDSALEHEASAFADALASGGMLPAITGRSDGATLHCEPKKKTITKIDVTFQHSDGHGNGVGKAHVVVTYDDGTTKPMDGDGGGKKDKRGIHPTSGGQHEILKGRDPDHHSSVYKGPDGKPASMKFYTPFADGEGFHRGNVNDESHGCIHMTESDAQEIFENAPTGVPVNIHVPKAAPPKKAPPKKEPPKKEPPKKQAPKKPAKKPPAKKKKAE